MAIDSDLTKQRITALLFEASELCGGGMEAPVLGVMANMLVAEFGGRPIGSLLMAVREGLKKPMVGHKLTWPILCEWMFDQDARVEEANYNEYLSHK